MLLRYDVFLIKPLNLWFPTLTFIRFLSQFDFLICTSFVCFYQIKPESTSIVHQSCSWLKILVRN
jgi:hypothetical protein